MYEAAVLDRVVDTGRADAHPWAGLDAEGAYRQAIRDALAICTETAERYGPLPAVGIRTVARSIAELVG